MTGRRNAEIVDRPHRVQAEIDLEESSTEHREQPMDSSCESEEAQALVDTLLDLAPDFVRQRLLLRGPPRFAVEDRQFCTTGRPRRFDRCRQLLPAERIESRLGGERMQLPGG